MIRNSDGIKITHSRKKQRSDQRETVQLLEGMLTGSPSTWQRSIPTVRLPTSLFVSKEASTAE